MTFKDLGLLPVFTDKCEQMGYTEPTPVQKQAIPVVLQGGDILASAETGTGKTAAFLLPILQMLGDNKGKPGTRVLVLSPTRELANQTEAACREFAPKGISCTAIIGGAGYKRQMDSLRRGANIIIATPGRLIDFMDQGLINFNNLTHLVLDEADRMLDMGFLPSIKRISKVIPAKRQTLFFSATMSAEIEHIAYAMLKDPTYIEVSPRGKALGLIEQTAYPVAQPFGASSRATLMCWSRPTLPLAASISIRSHTLSITISLRHPRITFTASAVRAVPATRVRRSRSLHSPKNIRCVLSSV